MLHLRELVIIEPRAFDARIVPREAKWIDQMQRGTCIGAEANHIAGVRWNLRSKENDIKHRVHADSKRYRGINAVVRGKIRPLATGASDNPRGHRCRTGTFQATRRFGQRGTGGHHIVDDGHVFAFQ